MNYQVIDGALRKWAIENDVPLLTEYRDEQVRAFELVGNKSHLSYQVWIDPPDRLDRTTVFAWDRKDWKISQSTSVFEIGKTLDLIFIEIQKYEANQA